MSKKEGARHSVWSIFYGVKKLVGFVSILISTVITIFLIIALIGVFSLFFSSTGVFKGGNVEVIPIDGVISTTSDSGLIGEKATVSGSIVDELKSADKNKDIKAVIFEINSPGGAPVATYEIVSQVKKMRKPVISVIRESGASGAFWIATSTNRIFANPMSITGSIGVVASHLEFAGLLKKYNVTYRRLVAGKYKDAGTPYKEMTLDEQVLFQKVLDKLHEQFIQSVADNRKLSFDQVRDLATGFIFLGSEAKEQGLIDELGGRDEAVAYLEKKLNITVEVFEYKEKGSLRGLLRGVLNDASFWFGKGMSSFLTENKQSITV